MADIFARRFRLAMLAGSCLFAPTIQAAGHCGLVYVGLFACDSITFTKRLTAECAARYPDLSATATATQASWVARNATLISRLRQACLQQPFPGEPPMDFDQALAATWQRLDSEKAAEPLEPTRKECESRLRSLELGGQMDRLLQDLDSDLQRELGKRATQTQ